MRPVAPGGRPPKDLRSRPSKGKRHGPPKVPREKRRGKRRR